MTDQAALIEKTVKQVMAILGEARISARTGRTIPGIGSVADDAPVASLIDHTLLKPEATARQIEKVCFEAKEYGFASVCVNSVYVPLAAELLKDSPVKVCTVVGFPLGASLPQVKAYEAEEAIRNGADEIDMVLPIGLLRSRDVVAVHEDISDVAVVCHERDDRETPVICKVIIETALLEDVEKIIASQLVRVAGADFVKTSTGFSTAGATLEDVALLRAVVGEGVGVKAAGGVRDLASAQAMVEAGANRIGASSGVRIAQEERGEYIQTSGSDGPY